MINNRSHFYKCLYAHMGTEEGMPVKLEDSIRIAAGQLLYESSSKVDNKWRASALKYAITTLFPNCLNYRSLDAKPISRSEDYPSTS